MPDLRYHARLSRRTRRGPPSGAGRPRLVPHAGSAEADQRTVEAAGERAARRGSFKMTLDSIYARIPKVACQRKCQEACGPIPMEPIEFVQIYKRAPRPEEKEFMGKPLMISGVTGQCPKLSRNGDCMAYENRPAICRIFGTVYAMACPFGCQPDRWLTDREAHEILSDIEGLAQPVGGPLEGK